MNAFRDRLKDIAFPQPTVAERHIEDNEASNGYCNQQTSCGLYSTAQVDASPMNFQVLKTFCESAV